MMRSLLVLYTILFLSPAVPGQTTPLSAGAKLLFQDVVTRLTAPEKNSIYQQLGFLLSDNRKQFIADKEAADFPFDAIAYPTDLNKDGMEEIFVVYGNGFTSGNTGSSVILFIKDAMGKYQPNLGFPGTLPDAIMPGSNPYPELVIGGPGYEFPVWKWQKNEYVFSRSIKDAGLKGLKLVSIEILSKQYRAGIK